MINEALQKVQTEVIGMLPTQYNLTNGLPTDRMLHLFLLPNVMFICRRVVVSWRRGR